ncbi:LOW QUALITY PROTEIN: inner centromere protein A-like [Elgaria multicarinata webbii]|uniref:LOW QUALITY PROTEIN: inner centromere protein A-like n=1 Tax=Elgaria multicarinata webbii TaxID=159646 RepID=UPI002FCD264E
MAEARGPTHLLDVCGQKFSEFLFNAEHKSLVWLREIEEEALKMFSSKFSAEPELMPKTPSQRKHRKKKRSLSFKDENKELTRKRLSRRRSSVKTASFPRLSLSQEGLKNLDVGIAVSISSLTTSSAKETSEMQSDKSDMAPGGGEALGNDCSQNIELKGKRDEGVDTTPELITVCSGGHSVDGSGATETAAAANSSPLILADAIDPRKAEKGWAASTPKASSNGKPTCQGEEILAQGLVNDLVPEDELTEDLKDSSEISAASRSSHHRPNKLHKKRSVSLVEKYSLANKRKSAVRKSMSRAIAKKKAAQDSSSASSRVSCHSSVEVFLDDETSKHGLYRKRLLLWMNRLMVSYAVQSPVQLEKQQNKVCGKETLETKSDSQINGSEVSAQNSNPLEQLKNSRKRSYKQAISELPAAQHTQDESPFISTHKATSSPTKKVVSSSSGPSKIIRPFKNFFQSMQKNHLLKSPGSPGHNTVRRKTPTKPALKGEFVEKERQRLESLRKKQEAEQQRKQKVEEEKRRRLEEIKRKREERLRKALQARERVEQMEEEKKKRIGQKFSQLEERSEKVREEKMTEEKTKKKMSIKKMGETEARKQKLLQMEEESKVQELPERWKTVGEIKKMLEHNSAHQGKGYHGQQDKERLMKPLELAVVTEEEENLKEEQNPTHLEQPQKEKKTAQVDAVPAASKWLNITAQKSPLGSSNQASSQDLKDATSLKVNPNDYGMDLNSDDSTDDESQPRKPIPSWANGLQLNEAVTYQYYNPPDITRLFGIILSPKLEDIFYKSKPRYFKRTSSAVWQSPPQPGTKTALRASNSMKKY